VAESPDAEPLLGWVSAALSNIVNWCRITSRLSNDDDDRNSILEESERTRRGTCQNLDTSISSSYVECFTGYAHFSEVMKRRRRVLQSEHRIFTVRARSARTWTPTVRRKSAGSSWGNGKATPPRTRHWRNRKRSYQERLALRDRHRHHHQQQQNISHPGLFRLHEYWPIHLFFGRPVFLLPVEVVSYSNLRTRVSFVFNAFWVHLHL
jgi:hypothetical protein